jgi:hypothetical protein
LIVVHLQIRIVFRKRRYPLLSHLECCLLAHLLLHFIG